MSWGWDTAPAVNYGDILTTPRKQAGKFSQGNGITFVEAAADDGKSIAWPDASVNVVSVGGTTLTLDANGNYVSETALPADAPPPRVSYNADPRQVTPSTTARPSMARKAGKSCAAPARGAPQWAALFAIANQGRALAGKHSLDAQHKLCPLWTVFPPPTSTPSPPPPPPPAAEARSLIESFAISPLSDLWLLVLLRQATRWHSPMAEMTLDEAFALASQLHQEGRLQEAEAGYRQIIAYVPNHADALNLLGVVTSQLGAAEGAEFIRQAIVLEPTSAHYRTNLAVALAQLGHARRRSSPFARRCYFSPMCRRRITILQISCARREAGRRGKHLSAGVDAAA